MARRVTIGLFAALVIWWGVASAQSAAPRPVAKPDANLLQLMRGTLYPASNVLFAAQDDLSKQPKPADASVSPNPLTNTYGGEQAGAERPAPADGTPRRLTGAL